ncbi:MAG: B12-binding domain-containing radical SAM protein [bacterium]
MKRKKNILFMTSAAPKISPFSTSEKRPPLGLGFLMAIVEEAGHTIFFSDEYLKPSRIIENGFLQKNNIDCVGIYTNTICFNGAMEALRKLQELRRRGKWDGKVMVGGPHASIRPEDFVDYSDYIVIGEGEKVVLDIIEENVANKILQGEKIEDLDSLPRPAWDKFVRLPYDWGDKWVNSYPIFTLNTSRGCPFNCKFCSVKGIWGKDYRSMSAKRIYNDILHLKENYRAECIYFREDNFTLNRERIVALCNMLIKNYIDVDWICETRADSLVDSKFVSLMAKAGCRAFYIGVESGSQRMLDFMKKGITTEQIIKAFENAHRANIKTYASLIYGVPTETKKDIELTNKLIKKIKPDFIGKNVFVGLPGSELYEYVKKNRLYEYQDEKGLLFLKGHNARVNKYYKFNPYFKIPSRVVKYECIFYNLFSKILKGLRFWIRKGT